MWGWAHRGEDGAGLLSSHLLISLVQLSLWGHPDSEASRPLLGLLDRASWQARWRTANRPGSLLATTSRPFTLPALQSGTGHRGNCPRSNLTEVSPSLRGKHGGHCCLGLGTWVSASTESATPDKMPRSLRSSHCPTHTPLQSPNCLPPFLMGLQGCIPEKIPCQESLCLVLQLHYITVHQCIQFILAAIICKT